MTTYFWFDDLLRMEGVPQGRHIQFRVGLARNSLRYHREAFFQAHWRWLTGGEQ
jgi:hypothetical protein